MRKKITLLTFLMSIYLVSFAQTPIFFEDFESSNSLPAGWTVYDQDGLNPANAFMTEAWIVGDILGEGNNRAWSTSYYVPAGQADDWLVTPQISLPDSPNVVLIFDAYPIDENFPDNYQVLVSTTGNQPADFDTTTGLILAEDNPVGGEVTTQAISLAEYANQDIYIAFRNVADDEFFLGIDNVLVKEIASLDLEISSIDMKKYLPNNENDVIATVTNQGGTTITSFDISWSINDEEEFTQSFTDLDIKTFEDFQVIHDEKWNAETGDFTLVVEISNINGEDEDEVTDNNIMEKDFQISSGLVQRKPLYEEFTSSTCGPCYTFNTLLYNPFFNTKNYENHSLVKYQVNWPGNGDPYYTPEVGVRRAYYAVDAAPTMVREGSKINFTSMGEMQSDYQKAYNDPAFFEMDLNATRDGKKINVSLTTLPYLNGSFKVFVAVVEKTTTENVTINGETEFYQVMMKMLPNAQGTTVDFTRDEEHTLTFDNINLENTFIEEFNDLQVVAWIQDDQTKTVMQSENTGDSEALNVVSFDVSALTMYPNPAQDVLHILSENKVDVVITDLLGQEVLSQARVKNDESIDISHLAAGVYFVNLTQNSTTITKKLIVK